jgi:hypothetical protein
MSTAFSNACIHSFPHVCCNPVKSFCSDVWNTQLSILFQFFQCVWVVFVHILLQKPPKTDGDRSGDQGGHKFREIMRPPKNSLNICTVEIAACAIAPSCSKPAVLFVSFQKGNEIHNQFLVTFRLFSFHWRKWDQLSSVERQHTILRLLRNVTVFRGRYAIFSTPYSAVLAINISIWMETCFITIENFIESVYTPLVPWVRALVKKTSLHFDCLKTIDGLVRAGYNMTWPAWALV